jgi:NADPH2:quinone reductase
LAKVYGLQVYGTASTPEGQELAKNHGCIEVFNHREPDYIEKIQQAVPNGTNFYISNISDLQVST